MFVHCRNPRARLPTCALLLATIVVATNIVTRIDLARIVVATSAGLRQPGAPHGGPKKTTLGARNFAQKIKNKNVVYFPHEKDAT